MTSDDIGEVLRRGLRRLNIATVVLFVLLAGGTYYAWTIASQANDLAGQIAAASLVNCQEIEQIKVGGRAAAWRDFNNLDQTLAVLGLKKTPKIVRVAKANRDRRLRQFRREPCPRSVLPPP